MKIDKLNAIILKELLIDGRKSFAEIAAKNDTSKEVVANRYKQMKKQGIIIGSTIQIGQAYHDANFGAFILIRSTPKKEESVIDGITKIPNIYLASRGQIYQNVVAFAAVKNVQELDNMRQSIKGLPFVLEVDIRLWLGLRDSPENLSVLSEASEKVSNSKVQPYKSHEIDETDKAIIEKLAMDARVPFSELAKELSISRDTTIRRYEKLRQNNDLRPVIQLNPIKLGYSAYAVFNLSFCHEEMSNALAALCRIPDVNMVFKINGKFDFFVTFMIRTIEEFADFQEQILNMPGLIEFELGINKMFPVWPLPKESISTF